MNVARDTTLEPKKQYKNKPYSYRIFQAKGSLQDRILESYYSSTEGAISYIGRISQVKIQDKRAFNKDAFLSFFILIILIHNYDENFVLLL
jgi:hypothetical protein